MAVNTSSVLGASLTSEDTTRLFAYGTRLQGTDDTWWEYVEATSTFVTGQLVVVTPQGTAMNFTTALAAAPGANGLDIGVAQFIISQGNFGYIAKQGRNLYLLCTGTIAAGTGVANASALGGRLQAMAAAAAGTMAGVYITTSASTGTASVAVGTVTWPRVLTTAGVIS